VAVPPDPLVAQDPEPHAFDHRPRPRVPRTIAFRDAGAEDRFFDIGFTDMQKDPIAAVRRLYTWLGEDLGAEAETRMAQWWDANSRERHGAHTYRPEDYGLDLEEIRRRFDFYTARFDVPPDRH